MLDLKYSSNLLFTPDFLPVFRAVVSAIIEYTGESKDWSKVLIMELNTAAEVTDAPF